MVNRPSSRYHDENSMENMRSILANLIALLHEMTPSHYTNYIDHFKIGEGTGRTDLIDFVMEVFVLFKDLIEQPVFPQVRKSYFLYGFGKPKNTATCNKSCLKISGWYYFFIYKCCKFFF